MNSRKIERLDSGILIPGGAKDLRIRDRRAPQPQVGAGIGGWFQLELVDRRGRLTWEHQQHNLFLDSGLDRIGQSAGGGGSTISASDLSHFAVGTGSTAPDVTDTVLDNELARTSTLAPGGFNDVRRVADGEYEVERTFQFDFGQANGNLTEVGFAFDSGPGNLWMRELIRDSGGTPITLTKTSDFILRGKYTLRFTLTPTTPTAGSFTVDGWGLLSGVYMFRGGSTGVTQAGMTDYRVFRRVAANSSVRGLAATAAASTTYTDIGALGSFDAVADSSRQVSSFTPGVWGREVDSTFGVSRGNGVIATIGIHGHSTTSGNATTPGFFFLIDSEDRPTKDNEHTLTIERIIGVTWGRA